MTLKDADVHAGKGILLETHTLKANSFEVYIRSKV